MPVLFSDYISSPIHWDPWFFSGLDSARWPKMKERVDLRDCTPSLWSNDPAHKVVGWPENHVTKRWLIVQFICPSDGAKHSGCSVHLLVIGACEDAAACLIRRLWLVRNRGLANFQRSSNLAEYLAFALVFELWWKTSQRRGGYVKLRVIWDYF